MRELPGSDRRIIWIPARNTLKHAVFNLPEQLTGKKRVSALKLKIGAWSPFSDTRFSVTWSGNVASVFAWDGEALDRRIADKGYNPTDCEIVPEAYIRQPGKNGIRLVSCNEGIEAQVWADGFLSTSRWWADVPSQTEWSLFVRTTGASVNLAPPAVVEPIWLENPWHISQTGGTLVNQIIRNEHLLAASVAILIAPCIYFASEWASYSTMRVVTTREISVVEDESRATRSQRAQALSALETTEDLFSLQRYPHQIQIMSKTHSLLQGHSVTLSSWDYDDGMLEFGLESEQDIDTRVFITAFESDPLFSSVSAGTRGNRIVMRMNISTIAESSL
ncbi:MAG: hypothetical protein P8L66_07305 [Rhodospirillaceae bacterium]|nr:hypothetical protein [Rhodospirillaceae bacterium]